MERPSRTVRGSWDVIYFLKGMTKSCLMVGVGVLARLMPRCFTHPRLWCCWHGHGHVIYFLKGILWSVTKRPFLVLNQSVSDCQSVGSFLHSGLLFVSFLTLALPKIEETMHQRWEETFLNSIFLMGVKGRPGSFWFSVYTECQALGLSLIIGSLTWWSWCSWVNQSNRKCRGLSNIDWIDN